MKLTAHMDMEESLVYPVLKDKVGAEDEEEAEVEHGLAREGLQKMRGMVSAPGFGATVEMLKGGITHHVQEEEGELLPELKEASTRDEWLALGDALAQAKEAAGVPVPQPQRRRSTKRRRTAGSRKWLRPGQRILGRPHVTDLDGRGPHLDDETLAEEIATLLDGRTVATAESVTAGRVAERLACAEGAVEFLRGGLVAYQEDTKRAMLEVRAPAVVSARAAAEMADGAVKLFGVDVAVSTTGLAGSAPQDGVPGGTVFVGTSVNGEVKVWE